MRTEEQIMSFAETLRNGDFLFEASPYWQEDSEIPMGVAIWFVRHVIQKQVLGTIPPDVFGFYCPLHKRAYLQKTSNKYGSGCDKCPSNNIWLDVK